MDIIIRSYAHRCLHTLESPPDICFILITAYQQTYCRIVIRSLQQFVNGIDIIIEFSGIFRSKRFRLKLNNNVGFQSDVIKQHINPAGMVAHDQFFLPPHKRETGTEFKKKPRDVLFQRSLKLFLLIIDWNCYKPEVIVVLCDFLRHTALGLRQIFRKIAYCPSMRLI